MRGMRPIPPPATSVARDETKVVAGDSAVQFDGFVPRGPSSCQLTLPSRAPKATILWRASSPSVAGQACALRVRGRSVQFDLQGANLARHERRRFESSRAHRDVEALRRPDSASRLVSMSSTRKSG